MSYNGYGSETQFGAYADGDPSYLITEYGAYGDPTLSTATRATNVSATTELQNLLIAKGFGSYLGSWGADGDFGNATRSAVSAYQSSAGLPATGVADQATWDSLRGLQPAAAPTSASTTSTTPSYRSGEERGGFLSDLFEGLGTGLGLSSFTPSGTAVAATNGKAAPPYVPPADKPVWPWVVGGLTVVVGGVVLFSMLRDKGDK
jgi:hypothetical protein